jgi:hypothetical protein
MRNARTARFALIIATLLGCVYGCDQPLETGYAPRRLNADESQRRSWYAPHYTPESQAKQEPSVAPNLGGGMHH